MFSPRQFLFVSPPFEFAPTGAHCSRLRIHHVATGGAIFAESSNRNAIIDVDKFVHPQSDRAKIGV
jgi:hypothetical protein